MIRVGQGVDVHAFSRDPGRRLVLGGITVPDAVGLEGHSDADVVLHAITDALLGAAALGDLGSVVGMDRPEHAGADSADFVARALHLIGQAGWAVGNVDATVLAQRPRLAAHVPAMRVRIAGLLGVGVEAVSVKATTTDHLGMIGRGEGIACTAITLLQAADGPLAD